MTEALDHGPALARVRLVAAHVAAALALLYAVLKLSWALGGDVLMRQTPLPRAARRDLLAGTPAMVAGHRATFGLALARVLAALCLAGWFTARGRLVRGLLLAGTMSAAILMVLRALGSAYEDLRLISVAGGDAVTRSLIRWDLLW